MIFFGESTGELIYKNWVMTPFFFLHIGITGKILASLSLLASVMCCTEIIWLLFSNSLLLGWQEEVL